MADTSKIRIRVGQVEIEYEGAHTYLSTGLPKLIESVVELGGRATGEELQEETSEKPAAKTKKGAITGTVAALAAKLDVKTGPDLAIASAAQLTLVEGHDTFTRDALLKGMKSATGYYKQSYSGNLSATLKNLLNAKRLTEPSSGNFALTAHERKQLEGKLSA